jgi:L-ascorbate metabolism protein UlaG (beta-lactamase superfamily)
VPQDRIVYLGHASVLLELQGTRILTDPLLLNRVLHLYRRSAPVAAKHYANIDAVLISHNQWDHLDLPSLADWIEKRASSRGMALEPCSVDAVIPTSRNCAKTRRRRSGLCA